MHAFIAHPFLHGHHTKTIPTSSPCRHNVLAKVDLTRPNSLSFPTLPTLLSRPPQPVVIARQQLSQDFAVLLMRSGYTAVDELDFVPMQQFQAVFFDIRSREWEKFIRRNLGMRQGVIADPRYFDFISYAQMLTIQHFMREPQIVFEEAYGDTDGSFRVRVVKRDVDRFPTPESLLRGWQRRVGEKIYEGLVEIVQRPTTVTGADDATLMQGIIKDIYDYFLLAGFCLDIQMTAGVGKTVCRVEMIAPCILWGCQALRRLRSIPNDYDCLCVDALCERHGIAGKCETKFTESSIVREWSVVGPAW